MAVRTPSQYEALYGNLGTEFPDNTTAEISEADMRNFGQDTKDSLLFVSSVLGSSSGVPYVFCGNADLTGDLFPTTGGTGSAGVPMKGNSYRVSVSGSPSGNFINVNAEIVALVDTPGQTYSNWWVKLF